MPDEQTAQEAEQPSSGPGFSRFIPWLIILALGLLFLPLYLTSATLVDSTAPLLTEASVLGATITAPAPVPPTEKALTDKFLELSGELSALGSIPPTLIAAHVDWPAIMAVIHSYDANQIQLTSFNHDTGSLTLQGSAMQESAVLDYSDTLQKTGLFSQVRVQSITVNPVPPPTPNLQATPTAGAVTLSSPYMPFVFTLSIALTEARNGSR